MLHGDLFSLLDGFVRDDAMDVVIFDPPYSERQHKGVRSSGRNRGLVDGNGRMSACATRRVVDLGFGHWTRRDVQACLYMLAGRVRRWIVAFCDDDLLPIWRACGKRAGFDVVKTSVWRRVGGAPQFTGDRPASDVEYIVTMHRKGKKRWNGGGSGISSEYLDDTPGVWLEHPIVANRSGHRTDRVHTTQKPLALMLDLVRLFSDPGETVVDLTAGSCTTGVACLRLGRGFLGFERDREKYQTGYDRLVAEERQVSLSSARAGQVPLFAAGNGGG